MSLHVDSICRFIFSLFKLFFLTQQSLGFLIFVFFPLTQRAKLLNLISLMWQKPVDSGSKRVTALILYHV